jgi:ABC-type glycerol-3-phosphate transport system permease component
VGAIASLSTVLLSASAAYALTRFKSFATDAMSLIGLGAYMLPGILIVVPVFRIAYSLHVLDSLGAITIAYVMYFTPFAVWQLRSYFTGIPRDLEDAAVVDGATRFEAFYLVILPQALPGLLATVILTFTFAWNEYLFASLLLYTPATQTLSAGMATTLIGKYDIYSWGVLMAGATLMTLPLAVAFMFIQRWLVAGFSSGAVKG